MGLGKVVTANNTARNRISTAPSAPTVGQGPEVDAYTALDAAKAIRQNRGQATRLLAVGGDQVSARERAQLEQIADHGILQNAGSGLATIFNFLDRPRKLIQLGIRDVFGFDSRRGGEIGLENYLQVLGGENQDLVESLGEDIVGEGGNLGTSQLLDDVWEYDTLNWWQKGLRGAVSLTGDVATDPLTYFTVGASGIGKVAAKEAADTAIRRAAARAAVRLGDETGVAVAGGIRELATNVAEEGAETALERGIYQSAKEQVDELVTKALNDLGDNPGIINLDVIRAEAIEDAVGIGEAGLKNIGAAVRYQNEIGKRMSTRTFGYGREGFDDGIWKDYVDHVHTRRGGERLGVAATTGGFRFTANPFNPKKSAKPILQGTGKSFRQLLGKPVATTKTGRRWQQRMTEWANKLDAKRPELLFAKEGQAAMWNPIRQAAEAQSAAFGSIGGDAVRGLDDLDKAIAGADGRGAAGVAVRDNAHRTLVKAVQEGGVLDTQLMAQLPEAVQEALRAALPKIQRAYSQAWDAALKVNPDLRKLDGHVPFYLNRAFVSDIKEILATPASGKARVVLPDSEEAAQKLVAELGGDITIDDVARFVEVQSTLMPSLRSGAAPGWAHEWNKRVTGKTTIVGEGEAITDDLLMLSPALQNIEEVNDSIFRVYKALVESRNLPFKPDKVKTALVLDPAEQLRMYVGSVQEHAIQRAMIQAASSLALIRDVPTVELVERVGQRITAETLPAFRAYLEAAGERVEAKLAKLGEDLVATKKVSIGRNVHVEVPRVLLDSPRVRQAVERVKTNLRRVKEIEGKAKADRARAAAGLRRSVPGLSEAEADQLVSLTSDGLLELRAALEAELFIQAEAISRGLHAVSQIESYDAAWRSSLIPSTDAIQALREQLAASMRELDRQWDEAFRTVDVPSPNVALTRYAEGPPIPGHTLEVNSAATAELMSRHVLTPVGEAVDTVLRLHREGLDAQRQALIARIPDDVAEVPREILVELDKIDIMDALARQIELGQISKAQLWTELQRINAADAHQRGLLLYAQISTQVQEARDFLLNEAVERGVKTSNRANSGWAAFLKWQDEGFDIMSEHLDDENLLYLIATGEALGMEAPWIHSYSNRAANLRTARPDMANPEFASWVTATYGADAAGEWRPLIWQAADYVEDARAVHTRFVKDLDWEHRVNLSTKITGGEGVSLTEAPLAALARLYHDPQALDVVLDRWDEISSIVARYLPGSPQLTIDVVDGVPHVDLIFDANFVATRIDESVPSLGAMADSLDAGDITRHQLHQADKPAVAVFSDLRRQLKDAARNRGQAARASTVRRKQIAEAEALIDELDDALSAAMRDPKKAGRLREWAVEFDSKGRGRPSAKLRKVEKFLEGAPHTVVALRRAIQTAGILDETSSAAVRSAAARMEAQWAGDALKPLGRAVDGLQRVIDEASAARVAAQEADLAETFKNVETFVKALSDFEAAVAAREAAPGRAAGGGVGVVELQGEQFAARRQAVIDAAKGLDAVGQKEKALRAKMRESLKATDETRVANPPEGFQSASAFGLEGQLGGQILDERLGLVFENMVATTKALHTPWGMQQLQETTGEIIRWWKSAATVSKPTFHFRNLISGVANGMMIGVGPLSYQRILAPLNKFRSLVKEGRDMDEIWALLAREFDEDTARMFEEAWGNGVFQGFARVEGVAGSAPFSRADRFSPASPDNVVFRAGGKTMETFEDVLRMGAFARHWDGAGSGRFAAQMTIAAHFDYQHLTMVEKKFKKIAPFFVWTRRNLPYQFQMMLENPSMINFFNHLQRNAQEMSGDDEFSAFPLSAFTSPLAVRMQSVSNEDSPLWARMIWDPDLPVRILDDLPLFTKDEPTGLVPVKIGTPYEWTHWITGLFGPQVSVPLSIFERGEWGQAELPRGLNEIALGVDMLVDTDFIDSSNGTARIARYGRDMIETFLPFYSEYRRFLGLKPVDPSRAQREGFAEDDAVFSGYSDLPRAIMSGGGRGFGAGFQTPKDTQGLAFDARDIVGDVRDRLALP